MGEDSGMEVPFEVGLECTVAPGTANATTMPCTVVLAEDNPVFDCLVPTVFHYAFDAYVVPSEGRLYWRPQGLGTGRVASMKVQVLAESPAAAAAVKEAENGQLARALVGALRA